MSLFQVNFREAFRSLWGARQRSLLALIGIVIGIGSVIGMVSIGTIVQQQAIRQFKDMGIDIVTIRRGGMSEGRKGEFSLELLQRLPEANPNVLTVAPYLTSGGDFFLGRKKTFLEQMGVTTAFFDLNKLQVIEGRSLSELDRNRYYCVVGSELAAFLKDNRGPVLGSQISADGRTYLVVGILGKAAEGGLRPYGINRGMLVPISTAFRAFQNAEIQMVMAKISPQAPFTQIKADLQDYFRKKTGGMMTEVVSAEELIESMKKQMQMFSLLLGAIGSISLIVGGIGVMNVMLISVSERRSEIGLRRALGAQQGDIQSQFLIESVILCLTGGMIGIILGIGTSYIFAYFSKWQFVMSYWAIALGVGVSTAVGVFCGFYPARTASRLDPIKALRS